VAGCPTRVVLSPSLMSPARRRAFPFMFGRRCRRISFIFAYLLLGEAIPEPSKLEAIMADPDNRDAAVIVVPVKTKSRTVRINVTLPEDTLKQIDRYAEAHGFSRSGFLAQAARRLMEAA
jgi:hypothetical protein